MGDSPSFSPSLPFLSFPPSPRKAAPLIQLGDLRKHCKLPQRFRAEPGRQTVFGKFRAPDNNRFDWIFNQLTVTDLHYLTYTE